MPLVLDPVLASGRGDEMATEDMVRALRELLLPRATISTPNSQEVRKLAAREGEDGEDNTLAHCAERLIGLGCEYVLVTGTHENTPRVVNTLYGSEGMLRADSWERLAGSYHGSGCTLASAVAAALAKGLNMSEAVREAQQFTWQSLAAGFRAGMGQLLPDRFFWARETGKGEKK